MKFKEISKYTPYKPKEVTFLEFCADLIKNQKIPSNVHDIDFTIEVVNTNIMHALAYIRDINLIKDFITLLESKIGMDKILELSQKEQQNNYHNSFISKIFAYTENSEIYNWAFNFLPKELISKDFLDDVDASTKERANPEDLEKYRTNFLQLYMTNYLSSIATKSDKVEEFLQTLFDKDFKVSEVRDEVQKMKNNPRTSLKWNGQMGLENFLRFVLEPKLEKIQMNNEISISSQNQKVSIL